MQQNLPRLILAGTNSGCGKTTLIRSLNGLIPHFYPGEIQGDLLMDGHSLLEMKPSELAGQERYSKTHALNSL